MNIVMDNLNVYNSPNIAAGVIDQIICSYKVQVNTWVRITAINFIVTPTSIFPQSTFTLKIDNKAVPELTNINAELTNTGIPFLLPKQIDVASGHSIKIIASNYSTSSGNYFAQIIGLIMSGNYKG